MTGDVHHHKYVWCDGRIALGWPVLDKLGSREKDSVGQ
jgi:hypothetical protein